MRAYLSVFRMRWKMELQYRGAVVGGVICQMFFGLILVALYRALYAGKPQSMPLSSVTTYVWLQQAFFRMLLSSDDELLDKIRTGNIAYDLCRPMQLYGFYYARIAAQKLLGSLLRAAPMMAFAILLPEGWGVGAPVSFPALAAAVLGLFFGFLCMCAMENLIMAVSMRTLDHRGMSAMMHLLTTLLAGNVLPLTLFPDAWQRVITALPYAQMLDAPIRLYTGERPLSEAPAALALQAFWTAALIALGLLLWQSNRKRLIVQGG